MNNLPRYTSVQGMLDSIVRSYLLNELPPQVGESSATAVRFHNVPTQLPERDSNLGNGDVQQGSGPGILPDDDNVQASGATRPPPPQTETKENEAIRKNMTSALQAATTEQQYVAAIYHCFQKRGVFKELQTFLRHKLVSILQDEWPNLQEPTRGTEYEPNTAVFRLVEDFLRCHRYLYTMSVLASESDISPYSGRRSVYGKLSAKEAEDLLHDVGIKRNSQSSEKILKSYFDKEGFSLLESINFLGVWLDESTNNQAKSKVIHVPPNCHGQGQDAKILKRRKVKGGCVSLSCTLVPRQTTSSSSDTSVLAENNHPVANETMLGIEERWLELERKMEVDNQRKLAEAIEKIRKQELEKLREELETKFRLLMMEKEKEHFDEVQRRVEEIKSLMNKERQSWVDVKLKHEKENFALREASVGMNLSGNQNVNLVAASSSSPNANLYTIPFSKRHPHLSISRKSYPLTSNDNDHSATEENLSRRPKLQSPESDNLNNQDRLAFLQYRLEQQNDEIKSLRNQVLRSPVIVTQQESSQRTVSQGQVENLNEKVEVKVNREENEQNPIESTTLRGILTAPVTRHESADLDTFLKEAKRRVENWDNAVSKVDEIANQILTKRRERSNAMRDESLRLCLSSARKKANTINTHQLLDLPSAMPRALVHQQIPEKQPIFTSQVQKRLPTFDLDYSSTATYFKDLSMPSGPSGFESLTIQNPTPLADMLFGIPQTVPALPQTPKHLTFSVPYEKPREEHAAAVKRKPPSGKHSKTSSKPAEAVVLFKAATSEGAPHSSASSASISTEDSPVALAENPPGESLFHEALRSMEAKEKEKEQKKGKRGNDVNLKEKAMRGGALSREKILSSDEGENSFSQSSLPFAIVKNGNRSGAISKNRESLNGTREADELPVKVTNPRKSSLNGNNGKTLPVKQPTPRQLSTKQDKNVQKPQSGNRSGNRSRSDSGSASFSISAPRSGEDANDFWQL